MLCAPGNAGHRAGRARRSTSASTTSPGIVGARARRAASTSSSSGPRCRWSPGLVDALQADGITAFGPSGAAARLEGSKAFAKEVMEAAGVPTARYEAVDHRRGRHGGDRPVGTATRSSSSTTGWRPARASSSPRTREVARDTLHEFLVEGRFGGEQVVVEEHLVGDELSLLALCDGERAIPMAPAQDYKRIFDGDEGPNTGGMGAYSPVPGADDVEALARAGPPAGRRPAARARHAVPRRPVRGADAHRRRRRRCSSSTSASATPRRRRCCRGCAPTSPRCSSARRRRGGLDGATLEWADDWAVTLVLASGGYPECVVEGRRHLRPGRGGPAGVEVTHAGTAARGDDIVTAGGRVLNVTALGPDAGSARDAAYAAADLITFDGRQLRRDIAQRAVERAMTEQTQPTTAEPLTETQTADLEELAEGAPRVGIIMGSKSDMEQMEKAGKVLEEAGVQHEIRVMSAHRDPDVVADYCKNARMRGLRVIIAGAGISAALPGVAAAHTDLPVIGVPLTSRAHRRRRPRRDPLDRPDAARRPGRLPSAWTTRATRPTWRCAS